ncbi:conserved Plasmodium protein, unknown function [Plasmodium gallinaceum]|uniref:Uncharacterized protein n=1 Tax=Plasmodium gallinaceum TaxID=5849 RepID=A0A1J1GYQ5_PLAGA|nr:conserved Plasmodium protein, unknown function [Plasmodium gallinaceum]CRG96139.1 conserved Plasmodium protein, unknown function [Plasmodium gallinaceum]
MRKKEKKDTSKKKRKDQAFIDFLYQNIIKKELFNIFKGKTYNNKKKEKYAIKNFNDRNDISKIKTTNEDEEYILFLKYIYNDVSSFIENNKNYHLINSNLLDIEDLMVNICDTICHRTFKNIKTIFDSSDEKTNSKTNNLIKETFKDENNINDSFFLIPPMEYIVSYINKLSCNDVKEFIKKNNFDKQTLFHTSVSTKLLDDEIINQYENLNNEEKIELQSKHYLTTDQYSTSNEIDEEKYKNVLECYSIEKKNLHDKKDVEEDYICVNKKVNQDKYIYMNNKIVNCYNEKNHDELDENKHINYLLSTDKKENVDCDIYNEYENISLYKHLKIYDSSDNNTSKNTNSVLSHLEEENVDFNSYYISSDSSKNKSTNINYLCSVSSNNEEVDEILYKNKKLEEKINITFLSDELMKNNCDNNDILYHTLNNVENNDLNDKIIKLRDFNKDILTGNDEYVCDKCYSSDSYKTKKDNLYEGNIYNDLENENNHSNNTNTYTCNSNNMDINIDDDNYDVIINNNNNVVEINNSDINNNESNDIGINNDGNYAFTNNNYNDINFNNDINNIDINNADTVDINKVTNNGDINNYVSEIDANDNNANDIEVNINNNTSSFNNNGINNICINESNVNKNVNNKDINNNDVNDSNIEEKEVNFEIRRLNENINKLNSCIEQNKYKNYIENINNSENNLDKEYNKVENIKMENINDPNEKNIKERNNDEKKTPKNIFKYDKKEYQERLQKLLKDTNCLKNESGEFRKNSNLHDDYYYFKYLNNYENKINPYHYTRVEKKANIQVTPSPFPQFLRDIQIFNVPQKKIRLKKTNVILNREKENKKEGKKSKMKKNIIKNEEKDKMI